MDDQLIDELVRGLELPQESISTLEDLGFMACYKYDHYEMYLPGMRFMETLGPWLRQFDVFDRPVALRLLRERLVFVSRRELQELAHFLFYNQISPRILADILDTEQLSPYDYRKAFDSYWRLYLRQCVFIGLSDGARIDFFRRHHIALSQDQVIPYYRASHEDYLQTLRNDLADPNATFRHVFLVDDFTASGYTLLREESDGTIRGSLERLYSHHKELIDRAEHVCVAYYIASVQARDHVLELLQKLPAYRGKSDFIAAQLLTPVNSVFAEQGESPVDFKAFCEKYYKASFENENTLKGGNLVFGFGGVGLTVVMHSNAPNNSVYPLWLQRDPSHQGDAFTALFRRIDRHRRR